MSSTHEKNPGMVASTSNPTAGEVDMDVDHWLANLGNSAYPKSLREILSMVDLWLPQACIGTYTHIPLSQHKEQYFTDHILFQVLTVFKQKYMKNEYNVWDYSHHVKC